MDNATFQAWLSAAEGLTASQRDEALGVLSGAPQAAASVAAVERGVGEERRCPHCHTPGAIKRGMARRLRRYQCKGCGKTFNAITGTPLSGLHRKERWLAFARGLGPGRDGARFGEALWDRSHNRVPLAASVPEGGGDRPEQVEGHR